MSLAKTICCKPFEFSSFSLKNLKVINSTSNRQLKSFLKLELKHERWKNSKELQTLLFRDSKQFGLICLFCFLLGWNILRCVCECVKKDISQLRRHKRRRPSEQCLIEKISHGKCALVFALAAVKYCK